MRVAAILYLPAVARLTGGPAQLAPSLGDEPPQLALLQRASSPGTASAEQPDQGAGEALAQQPDRGDERLGRHAKNLPDGRSPPKVRLVQAAVEFSWLVWGLLGAVVLWYAVFKGRKVQGDPVQTSSNFSSGWNACCGDGEGTFRMCCSPICQQAVCFPCARWAGTMHLANILEYTYGVLLATICYPFFPCMVIWGRRKLRAKYGVDGTWAEDCCLGCCCTDCAVCQEARHVHDRLGGDQEPLMAAGGGKPPPAGEAAPPQQVLAECPAVVTAQVVAEPSGAPIAAVAPEAQELGTTGADQA
eukprot:CAMPEP_0204260966 /NCGR_PEP_ID=MMETSP0468-20130131/6683_1 /ASSEMBLY_ACC=CAM_ASM_000383 /TAXON_ID=2969 /ORGANISM="Oxyrrhis marina" /LENGTH=301 /DNA_ID=CAMNT_0051235463 /DNA_START=38 /DNA_END=943 /DNA_ORIENTATION=+